MYSKFLTDVAEKSFEEKKFLWLVVNRCGWDNGCDMASCTSCVISYA